MHYHFSSPRLTCVFVHMRVEIKLQPSKNPGLLSSKQLYPSPFIKKTIRIATIPRSLCLSLSPAVSKNHWQPIRSRELNKGCIARRRIKKNEEEHMHPIKKSLLLITNVSCSSMDPKSTDVPPSLWSYRRSHLSASIAETGNEQHYRIMTSDGILLQEIDRYYVYRRSLKINLPGQWHALAAICW